jgi:hypothetical protein
LKDNKEWNDNENFDRNIVLLYFENDPGDIFWEDHQRQIYLTWKLKIGQRCN